MFGNLAADDEVEKVVVAEDDNDVTGIELLRTTCVSVVVVVSDGATCVGFAATLTLGGADETTTTFGAVI